MRSRLTGYDVGALLYCPANAHGSIVGAIVEQRFPTPYSLAFCLEDTVREDAVADAERMLRGTLSRIASAAEGGSFFLPPIFVRVRSPEQLLRLAEENGIEVVYVRRTVECPLGGAVLSLYPPVGEGDLNEQGLTALCSAGDFDVLITGDMAGSTERKLVGQYDLPDIEVLMVGHHGSRYSSSQELLQAVRPETAIISVGDNSYGHPTQEAMDRLSQAGAEIYRTDRQGNILVTVHGGD